MENQIFFKFPIDGDMLCSHDGEVRGDKLFTRITVDAEFYRPIRINGVDATFEDGLYYVDLELDAGENVLLADDAERGTPASIKVWYLPEYAGKYRVSLDDCIWYLRDIAEHDYDSIFENPYLAFLKEVHDTYGTKIHSNIYLEDVVDHKFVIDAFPDKYKAEWASCSDWLRLSFHARGDQPSRPYEGADYNKVYYDTMRVREQIRRFAGEEVMGPTTTMHFGMTGIEGSRGMRDAGYTIQVGDFNCDNGMIPVNYYLDLYQRRRMNARYIWRDTKEGITFFRCAIIVDCHKKDEICDFMDEIYSDPHRNPYIDFLIHEQYFYEDYCNYQPDYREKILTCVKWAQEKGYEPAFLDEVIKL